jgi:hypothetical protein
MQFDYLHGTRPAWMNALRRFSIPVHLVHGSYAIAAAAAIVAGSGLIERSRAIEAQTIESAYRQRYETSVRAVRAAHVYSERVASLVALDRQVGSIVASGDANAQRLAEIADRLPQHAWVTSISLDGKGAELEGRAKNFELVGRIVREFMRSRAVRNPVLTGAKIVTSPSHRTSIEYGIHLESAP